MSGAHDAAPRHHQALSKVNAAALRGWIGQSDPEIDGRDGDAEAQAEADYRQSAEASVAEAGGGDAERHQQQPEHGAAANAERGHQAARGHRAENRAEKLRGEKAPGLRVIERPGARDDRQDRPEQRVDEAGENEADVRGELSILQRLMRAQGAGEARRFGCARRHQA